MPAANAHTGIRGRATLVAAAKWLVPALAVALLVGTTVLLLTWRDPTQPLGNRRAVDAVAAFGLFGWSAVGALVLRRRPGNRVGLILLVAGFAAQAWLLAAYYAAYGLVGRPAPLPLAEAAAVASLWLPMIAFGLAFTFLFLLFPDGRLPTPGWRPFAWFAGAALLVWTVTWGTEPGPINSEIDTVTNPAGIELVGRIDPGLGWSLFVVAVLGSVLGLVTRLRRSSGVAREQLKWFTYAALIVAATWIAVTVASSVGEPFTTLGELMFPLALAALPLAVFVAIFKHQLYDIDAVTSRTIVVGALVALVTGGYVAVVALAGTLIGGSDDVSLAVAMVATALIAVAFHPVRLQVQRFAQRLVYGRRAAPYEVLATIGRRMGDAYAASDLLPLLAKTLAQGTGAARVEVWLRMDRQLVRSACWPADHQPAATSPLDADGCVQHQDPQSRLEEVRHQGKLVGALTVTMPPGHGLGPGETRLLADLAAQVGAAFDNIRLVEDLKSSRQRIVAAQYEERRRLERDIHDGVQQRLVSLSMALAMVSRHGSQAALDEAAAESVAALAELRRLARGIHPAILSEGGLEAAIESLAVRSSVPTVASCDVVKRLPAPVEVTVYYLAAEALTNVAKHAGATRADIAVHRTPTTVHVEVTDDGAGGAAPGPGSGLSGLADRVAALGGTLAVESPPGQGTRLWAEIPCESS